MLPQAPLPVCLRQESWVSAHTSSKTSLSSTGIAALREITGEEVPPWAKTTPGFSGSLAKLAKEADREG
jgi:hypothetical protein